jgi:hypothetical protein
MPRGVGFAPVEPTDVGVATHEGLAKRLPPALQRRQVGNHTELVAHKSSKQKRATATPRTISMKKRFLSFFTSLNLHYALPIVFVLRLPVVNNSFLSDAVRISEVTIQVFVDN